MLLAMKSGLILAAVVGFMAVSATASRGYQGAVIPSAPVTLTGWVNSVRWTAPQVVIEVMATDRNGPARVWTVLADPSAALARRGLCREAVKAGTHVTISGYEAGAKPCERGRKAGCTARGNYIVFDNGQTVDLGYRPGGAPLVGVPGRSDLAACK